MFVTRPSATFAELLAALEVIHPPSVNRLAPPATPAQIAMLESWLGVVVPSEALEVYAIHNGQADQFDVGCIFDRTLLSISQALFDLAVHDDIRRSGIVNDELHRLHTDERVSQGFPSASHVPILSDLTGNFIGYDIRPSDQGRFGQVVVFGADVDTWVVFDSIPELWGALINELHAGNWTLVKDEITGLTYLQFVELNETLRQLWA
jgi:cell wall assembly regulator SMI1